MADTGASDSLFQGIDSQTETQFIAAMTSTQVRPAYWFERISVCHMYMNMYLYYT